MGTECPNADSYLPVLQSSGLGHAERSGRRRNCQAGSSASIRPWETGAKQEACTALLSGGQSDTGVSQHIRGQAGSLPGQCLPCVTASMEVTVQKQDELLGTVCCYGENKGKVIKLKKKIFLAKSW